MFFWTCLAFSMIQQMLALGLSKPTDRLLWWLRRQRICLQCRGHGFNPWFGKIPWRREELPISVFWFREFLIPLVEFLIPLTVWIKTNWKILKEMGIPDHFTCLLRNLYTGQETTVRTRHGITDWFQIGKGVCQGCILSPCLFNLNAEYIMRKPGLEEAQAGIKISRKNINNLRYADDTTLMAESEEELKSLLMKMKEESEKMA